MAILGNFETTMIQKQFKVILINYKENYDTSTTTIQWVLTSVQSCLLFESVRILGNPCAGGYTHAHSLCAWLSHAHRALVLVPISVRVA